GIGTTDPGGYKLYVNGTLYATNKGSFISDLVKVTEDVELGDIVVPTGKIISYIADGTIPIIEVRKSNEGDKFGLPVAERLNHPELEDAQPFEEKDKRKVPAGQYASVVTYGFFNYLKSAEEIKAGDFLVPGPNGMAMKKKEGDGKNSIGIALSDAIFEDGIWKVAVLVGKNMADELKLSFDQKGNLVNGNGDIIGNSTLEADSSFDFIEEVIKEVKQALASLGLFIENGIAKVKELFAEKVTTKKLCIESEDEEEICIDKNQLKELLEGRDTSNVTEPEASACTPNWSCTEWELDPSSFACGQTFTQTRTCQDGCGNTKIEEQEVNGTKCEAPNATGTCQDRVCNFTCQEGFSDCDDDLSSGCETATSTCPI
ncbi:MAG: hypothetical protein QME57_01145, partial [Patescibacteria group bacterium]|nr:hypothetical protein [Patescibacteria group bacterium]